MQIFLSSFGVELKICKLVFLLLLFEDSYVNQTYLIFFHLVLQKKKKKSWDLGWGFCGCF